MLLRILFLAITLAGCSSNDPMLEYEHNYPTLQLRERLGSEFYTLLTAPDRVEGFSLTSDEKPMVLTSAQIQQLQLLLLNDQHYLFDIKKKIVFIPSYAFKFTKNSKELILHVSLPSRQVQF